MLASRKPILRLLFSFSIVASLLVSGHESKAQDPNIFFYVSDGDDRLYTINRNTGAVVNIGATGRTAIEAIAYYPIPGSQTLYAADAGDFGTLNISTGTFTLIGQIDGGGTASGSAGNQSLNDVDGLMLDGQTLIMWAVERNSGASDLLFQIDLTTGQFVPDAFGPGVDYLQITGAGINLDVDDIAVDPVSGEIYGVSNNGGSGDVLFKVNKATGEFLFVATLAQNDVEGLAFNNDGSLYGSEGNANNRLSLINKTTGAMTNFRTFTGSDVEGLAALVANANSVTGTVYNDLDVDGIKDGGEPGLANVTVYLYVDNDGDGQVDPEDSRVQTTTTDVNGDYSFSYITTGTLITTTRAISYPSGFSLTTDNLETMSFTDGINFGETDTGNDFGLATGADCDGDGLTDFFEGNGDSDGDGVLDKCDLDSDNDGILDSVEGSEDYDDDGIPNYLDRDSDDDGIPDAIEANAGIRPTEYVASQGNLSGPVGANGIVDTRETSAESGVMIAVNPDSDNDGNIDVLDLDSDNDGILDLREAGATADSDNDGQVDNIIDANGNGYADALESNPLAIANTDLFYENSNGLTQRPNYLDIDSDADGIDDTREGLSTIGYRFPTLLGDNDDDGILDFWDTSNGENPIVPVDTDSDGIPDYLDINSDNDSRSDFIEGNDVNNDGVADQTNLGVDADNNGLDDRFDPGCSASSVACSSNVAHQDTDSNGEDDFRDSNGTPSQIDTDGDGVTDINDIDDDNDGILDLDEGGADFDGDGIINSLDLDSDNDGIFDIIEAGGVDGDTDGVVDGAFTDTDGDGWSNTFDPDNGGTVLVNPDSDGDGNQNYLDLDSDGDGVVDLIESQATTGTPIIPVGADSDGDGIDNAFDDDFVSGVPTVPVDTDSDGTPDYIDQDSDEDGLPDYIEAWDTNGDLSPNTVATGSDSDLDGLDNAFDNVFGPNRTTNAYNNEDALDFPDVTTSGLTTERDWREDNGTDTDGDGVINSIDIDDDNDGTLDVDESLADFDNDGIPNSLDLDSDNDGIPDIIEAGGVDTNNDGVVDGAFTDTNGNGWSNTFDPANGGTILVNPDSDGDGNKNYLDLDSDGDGIVDLIESQATTISTVVPSGTDTDGDGLDDAFDGDCAPCGGVTGVPIVPVDTDADSTPDYLDLNSDNDDFIDALEAWDTNGDLTADTTPSGIDTDNDGLDDAYDDIVGPNSTTNPTNGQTSFSFPDVTTVGNSERDWRESNLPDADLDGLPDVDDIDDDNDGILDTDEGASTDTDGDGIVDRLDLDSDNDGIPDIIEAGGVDTNNDGRVDDDTDTDGDGWANTFDSDNAGTALINPDTDLDGIKNYLDLDADNDGIEDIIEAGGVDTDNDGVVDSATDTDTDGWANTFDSDNGGTVLSNPDTDGDGLANNIDIDADGDGIVDLIESQATTGSPIVPVGTDTDGDGIDNAFDSDNGGTPGTPVDTDADATPDYIDFNSDNDSFSDALEGWDTDNDQVANTVPAGLDSDGDGLDNAYDNIVGPNATTNAYNNEDANDFPDVSTSGQTTERDWREVNALDADFDGVADGVDIDDDNDGILDVDELGDTDGDGIVDRLDLDSDNDGIPDIIEAGGVDTNNDGRVDVATDTDGDGWANTFDSDNGGTALADPDSDNDGVKNRVDLDSDNDGILDVIEANLVDANGDGKIDSIIDANGTGWADSVEGTVFVLPNTDLAYENANSLPNLPNYIDIDSDADGIDDTREGYSTAAYAFPDSFTDTDGDGILNFWDVDSGNSPIDPVDTDGAGLDDYVDTNSDNDSLSDFIEGNDFNKDGIADAANTGLDTNGNGLDDTFDQDCYGTSVSSSATSFGEQQGSSVNIGSSDLELVTDGGNNQIIGIYFPNITISQGASINSATIQFQTDEATTGIVNLTIEGQLATSPATFITGSNNVSARSRTTADEAWSPANWTTVGEAGAAQRTVDISSIIQEIVGQGGWSSGNAIVIIITGPTDGDTRTAEVNPTLTVNFGGGITACTSNVALQDADLDGEKDFRDTNGIAAIPDTDGDGVNDFDDIDDDNDGILDTDEGCTDITVAGANGTVASQIVARVEDTADGIDGQNGTFARFRDNGAQMEVQLRGGSIVVAGTQVTVRAQKRDNVGSTMTVTESINGTDYINSIEYSFADDDIYEDKIYTLTTDATHIRITYNEVSGDLRVDNVSYAGFIIPCTGIDTDSDGIPDHLDIDADNDGIVDLIEAQATTGTPVVPVGVDTDGDGYDDAFDADCAPCGGITGVPTTTPTDTDGDLIPDFQDLNSDGDSFSDLLEGWDTDGNLVANTVPSGTDTDGDGLDDAFDLVNGINSTTNVYNTQDANDFPDVTTGGNVERDWREVNAPDSDFDGIINTNDIDDDNDGILDVDEDSGCSLTQTLNYEFYDGLPTGETVDNIPTTGALGTGTIGDFDVASLQNTVDNGDTDTYGIRYTGFISIATTETYTFYTRSDDGTKLFVNGVEVVANDGLHNDVSELSGTIALTPGVYSFKLLYFENTGGQSIFASYSSGTVTKTIIPFTVLSATQPCDLDGDGIINSLDLDSDNDGIPDIIEAGGVDADNDGRVDNYVESGTNGWADTFDNVETSGTPLTDPDTDNDGIKDYKDLDSDNDGTEDIIEAGGVDTNNDGVVDSAADLDEDGWANTFDSDNGGTVLTNPDTDGDGLRNNIDIDSDGDGIVDLIESQATTGTPVIPAGSDTDGDGIDNAFDTTGGTPITPVDTDGDGTPDYLDINSDNDSALDALEGWDTNGDNIADTTPAGTDTDSDGLDDAYDDIVGPNNTTNVYNNEDALDFPDVTTSVGNGGTTERDWREANVIDTDFDGVADADDIDDDNDGILDVDEGFVPCVPGGSITAVGTDLNIDVGTTTTLFDGVTNGQNFYWVNNQAFANTQRDIFKLTFNQIILLSEIRVVLTFDVGTNSFIDTGVEYEWQGSNNNSTWTTIPGTNNTQAQRALTGAELNAVPSESEIFDLSANTTQYQYYRLRWLSGGQIVWDPFIEEITFTEGVCAGNSLDTDNDGIPDYLDTDSDNDGIPDIIEAGGVDTNNDGRVDNNTDTDGDGWANTFDNSNGGTALTDPDSDGDGLENRIDLDSDGDGIADLIESQGTTGSPVIPVGVDSDQDGIDDAFDVNCAPCGAVTGVPTVLVNTDGTDLADYLDTDSDNDGLTDLVEAWDEDGDYLADTSPNGSDADNDGIDDAFDEVVGPNLTTNVYNSQTANSFPDITTADQTTERDWRESNTNSCEPGGTGSNILLWLSADNGGTSWRDISNNYINVDANGTPNGGSSINFNPSNFLNGSSFYTTNLNINADTHPDLAVIAVYQPSQNNSGALWGEDNGGFDRYILDGAGANENEAVSNGTASQANFTGLFSPLIPTISTVIFDEDQASGSSVYVNGNQVATFSSDHGGETSNNFQVGAIGNGTRQFNGNVAEVIVYNQLLSTATDLQKIHSYLAIKYGITLPADYIKSNGELFWDASDNASFQNNLAGIARDDLSCLNQLQSQSVNSDAIVAIGLDSDTDGLEGSNSLNQSSFSADRSSLMWSHDGSALYDPNNVEFDKTQVRTRLNREWRARETGTVGTVTIRFDVSGLLGPDGVGTNNESRIVLLVDQDGDFSANATVVSQSFVVADDGFVSFQVDLADGNYFTLGSGELGALPITLLSFTGESKADHVALNWITTSENNNSHFRIERSINGYDFETVGFMDGAGTTNQTNSYEFKDHSPIKGLSFYRLIDIDFSGEENPSELISIKYSKPLAEVKVYPNPAAIGASFTINVARDVEVGPVQMYQLNGVTVSSAVQRSGDQLVIQPKGLKGGVYLLSVMLDGQRFKFRVIIR